MKGMSLNSANVLVIGGGGFIGSRLVEKLVTEQNANVKVFVRNINRAVRVSRYSIELCIGDAANQEILGQAMKDIDIVFDCTYSKGGTANERIQKARDVTTSVIKAVQESPVPRLVHVSSAAVYGHSNVDVLDETCSYKSTNDPYTESKTAAERCIVDNINHNKTPAVIVQPTVVYGPYSGWSYGIISQLKTGTVALANGGSGLCNAVYIDDVVDALILAATRDNVEGEKFLISGSGPVSWREFYSCFEAILGVDSTVAMAEKEIIQAISERRRKNKPIVLLMNALRGNPEFRQLIINLPVISQVFKVVRRCSSDKLWNNVKGQFVETNDGASYSSSDTVLPLTLPSKEQLDLFVSTTTVCIDKAKRLLNYTPKFGLSEGMRLTGAWASWANLV